VLARQPEHRPARHEHAETRRRREHLADQGRSVVDALEVVEQQDDDAVSERVPDAVDRRLGSRLPRKGVCDRGDDVSRVLERCEVDEVAAVRERPGQFPRRLERESRLARPARPRQRDEPNVRAPQQGGDGGELELAPARREFP